MTYLSSYQSRCRVNVMVKRRTGIGALVVMRNIVIWVVARMRMAGRMMMKLSCGNVRRALEIYLGISIFGSP
jgi:hypothetical protein